MTIVQSIIQWRYPVDQCFYGEFIAGHIKIADHVKVSAGTLISRSLTKPGTYTGIYPFDEHEAWKRSAVRLRRLAKGKKED